MRKFLVLLISMNLMYCLLYAQNGYTLSGTITDENATPLIGATVVLSAAERSTITDNSGHFIIKNIQQGSYKIEVAFIGYESNIDTILINSNKTYNCQLTTSALSLQEVVVNDNYIEILKKQEALNIEVVNDDYLRQNLGGSLMQSLARLPGISTIEIGSCQSKPVIRGLGFNRVVVVENNIKHEAQQWGVDHGLEIDQYAIENVEIIKGPSSLMYGSDAIGGVIIMKNRKLPTENTIGGTIDLTGKTNNDFLGTSLSLYGRKKHFFADIRLTLLDYGDYKVPTDSVDIYSYKAALYKNHLRNTAGNEQDLHLSFGFIKDEFQSRFYVSNTHSKSGFFANAHGLEPREVDSELHDKSSRDINDPYQSVNHFKIINTSQYQWEKLQIESDLGFQHNLRNEKNKYTSHGDMPATLDDSLNMDHYLERQFNKYVYSGNLKLSYERSENTRFVWGLSGEYQDNSIDGYDFIFPAYNQLQIGSFVVAKHSFSERSIIQMGIRYDYGKIKTQEYYDWYLTENEDDTTYVQRAENLDLTFPNISWSLGYSYNTKLWSLKANIGKSFRMPTAKELGSNGINFHYYRYEIGSSDLSPEISWQFDAGAEYNNKNIAIGTTPFVNYFSNYIYLNPTSEHDPDNSGYQRCYYLQSKVFRCGAEIHAHYQVLKSLQLGIIGEYVYSIQLSGEKEGYTLPFSPPASAILNIKYQKQKIKFIENAYATVDYRITAKQDNVVPPEVATDGYQVVNVGIGGDIPFINQMVNISLQIQNLLNNKYFNHTSFYRLINVPEPGRSFIVNISVPISGKTKQ